MCEECVCVCVCVCEECVCVCVCEVCGVCGCVRYKHMFIFEIAYSRLKIWPVKHMYYNYCSSTDN